MAKKSTPVAKRSASAKTKKKAAAKKKTVAKKKASAKKAPAKKKTVAGKKKATARKVTTRKPAAAKAARTPAPRSPRSARKTRGAKARKLKAAEVEKFRKALLALRDRMAGQVNSLRDGSLRRSDKVNTTEDGTDAFDRQFALSLASSEGNVLFEIDDALRRIEEGTYGICESSGEPIEKARLEAIPFARHSLAAQAELERGKGPYRQASARRSL